MSGTDLILRGTVTLGGTDVSAEVTGVILKSTINDVAIPATLTVDQSHAPGARKHEIQIDYLATDGVDGVLFDKLYTAVLTASKELAFVARMRTGARSATNPEWSGTMVVSGTDLGGDEEALSTGSITCTLTGEPVRNVTP